MSKQVPSTASALFTLAGVTWKRLLRGRALWVALVIACLPILMGSATRDDDPVVALSFLVMCVLPAVFVASALGEEIEERTSTYLWSRPLPRWTLLIGKLIALAPIASALIAGSWFVAMQSATGTAPDGRTTAAFAVGGLAVSAVSAALGARVPRHGTAVSIAYFIIVDLPVGAIPAAVQELSITRQVRLLANFENGSISTALIAMAVIVVGSLATALRRVNKLES